MPSERIQRRIDALLDEADEAAGRKAWDTVIENAAAVLGIDPTNEDAKSYLQMARSAQDASGPVAVPPVAAREETSVHEPAPRPATAPLPHSVSSGRYRVLRQLGQGARKRVYLARDEKLGREVALALIPGEGLTAAERERVLREAQSMARLGASPHLVSIFDIGEDGTNLFTVQEFMAGGDVATALKEPHPAPADGGPDYPGLPVERTLAIARDVCRALDAIHRAGIIHRDLKPANVFLAADGSARVGDLGLATNAGLDRLTQYGTMLGTVAYMPPEQALGGEVTPRADLYSLGAMLYEMVTGRPPFIGDDPTAVISQHINTPPVAPSWLTEQCPPPLEHLILRLLAKDPGGRPESALAVLGDLEGIDPTQKSVTHSESNALDRLARGVFVGRESELERLRTAFDEATAGRGSLVMLVGEPGIGKTRTTQELETYARMRGAQVLWGRAHESSGAPPFWPWVQVGRMWGATNDIGALQDMMRATGGELVRLFPELRAVPGFFEPEPSEDAESTQFRLFDAYVTLVRGISAQSPILLVLDDLHWADKPSLMLLQHLARELGRMRVLVVGTFRDTDLSRTHPLSEALASLNREAGFQRVVLRGLTEAEVAAYIRGVANAEPRPETVHRIFEETEGNPFFLGEVVNLLTQEGTLLRESVSDIAVPDGVREALGRRLDRISEETNELLQVAAVVGREFTYDTLTLLGDRDEESLLRLIEEALGARVIEEMPQPGRYRFTHALMQETLLEELSTTRRVRLHGQVGEALEKRWGARADERAPRLAEHFVEASTFSERHAHKAVRYARLAAEAAELQAAWAEAAKWYDQCLSVMSGVEFEFQEDEAALLVALAVNLRNNLALAAAGRNLRRALELYRARGEVRALAAAAVELASIPGSRARRRPVIDDALAVLGGTDPHLEARLLLLGENFESAPLSAGVAGRVREVASGAGSFPDLDGALAANAAFEAFYERRFADGLALAAKLGEVTGSELGGTIGLAKLLEALVPGFVGEVDPGKLHAEDRLAGFRKAHAELLALNVELRLAGLALSRGDFGDAEERWGRMDLSTVYSAKLQLALRAELRGDLRSALSLLPDLAQAAGLETWVAQLSAGRARVRHLAGDAAGAREELAVFLDAFSVFRLDGFNFSIFYPILELGEALVTLADDETAETIYRHLQHCSPVRWDPITARGSDALAGQLGLRLGRVEEAEARFQAGLAWATRGGLLLEQGRNLQGLAEVAARRGDVPAALDLLDRAAAPYRQWGARRLLDEVIARKVELQGITSDDMASSIVAVSTAVRSERPDLRSATAPDGTVTILFSDIENSTALNEKMGDARWIDLLREHDAMVRRLVAAHGGFIVKTMGDGFMVAFQGAGAGAACALAIQGAMAEEPRFRVRIGLHTGEMVREGDDFFGRHVNLAARVAAAASGGQVLVSSLVRDLVAASAEFTFDEGRELSLKGLSGTHRVHELLGTG